MGSKTDTGVGREEAVETYKRYGKRESQGSKEEKGRFAGKGFGGLISWALCSREVLVVYAVARGVKKQRQRGPKTAAIVPEMSVVLWTAATWCTVRDVEDFVA